MKVLQLRAEPAAEGRVRVAWRTPPDASFRGTRVLRRERRFAGVAELGSVAEVFHDAVTPAGSETRYVDGPLQGETVYYYTVVAYDAAGKLFPEFVSVLASAPYHTDDHLYRSLPEIYQMFDRAQASNDPGGAAGAHAQGRLRRLVEMLGQPFDLVRSYTSAMRDFHNVDRVDGALLPLLAQWIALPSDATLDLDRQRNEIRYAPQYYRTTGVPANLRASINRFVNWDARIKEFVHNVLLITHPEQLTIWEMRRDGAQWTAPRSVNLDIAFEGRAAPLQTADGRTWLMYHARRSAPAASAGSSTASGPGHDRLAHLRQDRGSRRRAGVDPPDVRERLAQASVGRRPARRRGVGLLRPVSECGWPAGAGDRLAGHVGRPGGTARTGPRYCRRTVRARRRQRLRDHDRRQDPGRLRGA